MRDSRFAPSSAVGPGPEELSGAGRSRPENFWFNVASMLVPAHANPSLLFIDGAD